MKARSDRKIQISRNETLKLTTANAQLTRLGTDTAPSQELQIGPTAKRRVIRIEAKATNIEGLRVTSDTGEIWETTLFPGTNLIDLVVEPNPEERYCENDTGDPPHPVSKGDRCCKFCGGKVIHGSK